MPHPPAGYKRERRRATCGRADCRTSLPRRSIWGYCTAMLPPRVKKLIGMLLLVALVIVYALVATTVAVARLQDSSWLVHLGFFFISGLLWVIPAMFIVSWMAKAGRSKS